MKLFLWCTLKNSAIVNMKLVAKWWSACRESLPSTTFYYPELHVVQLHVFFTRGNGEEELGVLARMSISQLEKGLFVCAASFFTRGND